MGPGRVAEAIALLDHGDVRRVLIRGGRMSREVIMLRDPAGKPADTARFRLFMETVFRLCYYGTDLSDR